MNGRWCFKKGGVGYGYWWWLKITLGGIMLVLIMKEKEVSD